MDDTISRQAAIDALRNRWLKTMNCDGIGEDIAEECEICLRTVPSVQPTVNTARNMDMNIIPMSYGTATDIIENSNESTDEQIMISAIYKILMMETINAVTKDVLKKAVNYLFNKMYSIED